MLSDRIRPNTEAAPWVVQEVKLMEANIKRLEEALNESLYLNLDLISATRPFGMSELDHFSEYSNVIDKAKEALKLSEKKK